jgi:hypothetical protein
MHDLSKRLILIELNEINFDIVEKYISADTERFPALAKMLKGAGIRTTAEKNYEELEPWIQWPSVHTVKTYAEHSVFRLGDIVGSNKPQIFEAIEQAGYSVGAISAMNAENRLKNPAYFIPDPWTQTPTDSSWWSTVIGEAVAQAVNDNAKARISVKSAMTIMLALLRFTQTRHWAKMLGLIRGSRTKPWMKALVLDLLLHDIHWKLFNLKKPNFSTLFLNAGAHIQHHYFFNAAPLKSESLLSNPEWYVDASADPLADVLATYDLIVGEYFSRSDTEVVLATGLTQKPYNRLKFYYRLNAHAEFLRLHGIDCVSVVPRMTRDFLVELKDADTAQAAQEILSSIQIESDGLPLFGEIDNRGQSLFVTMTYPNEITQETRYVGRNHSDRLRNKVSFVAIKNGMHHAEGFAFFTSAIARFAPTNLSHVSQLGKSILAFFGVPSVAPSVKN